MKKKSGKLGKTISEEIKEALDAPKEDAKIRITTMIDYAVYEALKADAKARGSKYQTVLNKILLDHYFAPKEEFTPGVGAVFKNEAGDILKRLTKLEKIVLKKDKSA